MGAAAEVAAKQLVRNRTERIADAGQFNFSRARSEE